MTDTQKTVALVVAYDGSGFHGFQVQPGCVTVQGRLEEALETVLGRPTRLTCAGRTDAGVHALGQVVSFEVPESAPDLRSLRRSVDALAGPGIVVREALAASEGFSARHDAVRREYRYRLALGQVPLLFTADYAWHVTTTLDVEAMREAADLLVGEHDFKSFCVAESARVRPTVRHVLSIDITDQEDLGERSVVIDVAGRSFLHSMVRVIVGTLVEVGRGDHEPGWVTQVMDAADRATAGPTAPAAGLTMMRVGYPEGMLRDRVE